MDIPKSARCIALGLGNQFWRYRQEIFNDYNIIYATDNNFSLDKGVGIKLNNVAIYPPPERYECI